MTRLTAMARAGLPAGRPLPEAAWLARHRGMLVVLDLHVLGILGMSWAAGTPVRGAIWAGGITLLGATASRSALSRVVRACLVSLAILACSAFLIETTGGEPWAHAHLLLVLALISLYSEWAPYLLAIGTVTAHHLLLAGIDPERLFNRPEAMGQPFLWAGRYVAVVAIASAIYVTSWRLSEAERERTDRVLDATPDGIFGVDRAGRITFANAAVGEALGLADDELLDRHHHEVMGHGRPDGDRYEPVGCRVCIAVMAADRSAIADDTFTRADGSRFPIELSASPIRRRGERTGTVITFRDLTERAALTRRALHDPLTGLPNRALLADLLDRALARQDRVGGMVGLLFVDLDRFKVVNDSLGHAAGDQLLTEAAIRLRGATREHDAVARLGGDEFVILCDDLTDEAQVVVIAERVVGALNAPYSIAGHEVFSSASVGITLVRRDQLPKPDADAMLVDADAAMYRAKEAGRGRYELFDAGMRERAQARMSLETDLRKALFSGQIEVHYQPKVDLVDGRITGVEALARWTHPERGAIPPAVFIPIAEETGLIAALGMHVLERACADSRTWAAGAGLLISVNLSGRQLQQHDLADQVREVLERTGVDPALLALEITESVLMTDIDLAVSALDELKAIGVKIAVDDFGTGYSSLAYLTRFPVDILKVDRSFVIGITDGGQSWSIVSAVVGLAKALGLSTVAEGVEHAEQLDALRDLGCELAQGFHLARPMPADQLGQVLALGLGARTAEVG